MNSTGQISEAETLPLVLVVDDDRAHIRLLEVLAETLKIRVHGVLSCKEALEALEQASFDMVLMDWRMPEADGCQCTQQVRLWQAAAMADLPIIGISAYNSEANIKLCLDAGMNDFLAKPFTLVQLLAIMKKWNVYKQISPPNTVANDGSIN
jgi:two-component system sensor histidine kinase BarA